MQHSPWVVSLYMIGGNGWLYPTIRIRCPCFIHNSYNLSGSGNISIKLQPENSHSSIPAEPAPGLCLLQLQQIRL